MGDLHQSGDFAFADPGDPVAEEVEQVFDFFKGLTWARDRDGEFAGGDHGRISADWRAQELAALLGCDATDLGGDLGVDGRGVDDDSGGVALVGEQPTWTGDDLLKVLGRRDHDEDDVAVGQLDGLIHDLGAFGCHGLGLGSGPVIDRHIMACIKKPSSQRKPHPTSTNPPNLDRTRTRHNQLLQAKVTQSIAVLNHYSRKQKRTSTTLAKLSRIPPLVKGFRSDADNL
ncbi:hypothetical protein GALL_510970 [mine drainage metagenome]|uniref:Uncharacterized protein n=1 Tax=mine drainage metagenome TaxID=410659 RepID=A0A1J5PIG2_9ZZZZ